MRQLASRLLQAGITMIVAVSLVFVAMRALPGHPLLSKFGQHPDAEQIQKIRQQQGWDRPVLTQWTEFISRLLTRGDLGESLTRSNERISAELVRRFPATLELALVAMFIAVPLGITLGSAAAVWTRQWPDLACLSYSLLGVSVPVFFLGLVLRGVFTSMPIGFRLPITAIDFEPTSGLYLVDTLWSGDYSLFRAAVRHLCLPALTLSTIPAAFIAQVTRSSMLNIKRADYLRTAAAKGASGWRIAWRHSFPNAAPPIVSMTIFQLGALLSGAVMTESVFDWPGLGKYIVDAIQENDYSVVQAGCLCVVATFVSVNLVLDLILLWLDPRIRTQ